MSACVARSELDTFKHERHTKEANEHPIVDHPLKVVLEHQVSRVEFTLQVFAQHRNVEELVGLLWRRLVVVLALFDPGGTCNVASIAFECGRER